MRFEFYRDERSEWRWTLVAGNSRKLADSGEGYKNQADMMKGIALVKGTATIAVRPRADEARKMELARALAGRARATIIGSGIR